MSANIALMCKTNNDKQNPQSSNTGEYRVGNWVISEVKRKELLGGTVVLTQSQKNLKRNLGVFGGPSAD